MEQLVIKADDKKEDFNRDKLNASLLKAGASSELSGSATDEVDRQFKNCMNTDDIYNRALDHIRKIDPKIALKYTLKRAIMSLGPDGFVFEKYVAKILEQNGYTAEMPQLLSGFCVDHEVDIIAERKDEHIMVECKYHNVSGIQSDIKTVLYINSRFLDLKKGWENKNHSEDSNDRLNNAYFFNRAWLFTNTKCTIDAIKYASCSGMKITAWNYPENESLQFYIESKKLYPITILSTLSENHKRALFKRNILTVKELIACRIEELMELLSIDTDYAAKILDEISLISS